jgi:AP-4 complex subunit beta-1
MCVQVFLLLFNFKCVSLTPCYYVSVTKYLHIYAVMGVLKLYNLDREFVKESNMIDLLYNMIQDVDGGVVANCIMVLNEIMLNDKEQGCGGMAVNQPLIHHLLGRLNDFNEWGLHQVLEVVARYSPSDDQEVVKKETIFLIFF